MADLLSQSQALSILPDAMSLNRLSSGRYSWLYSACLLLPQNPRGPIIRKGNSSTLKIWWCRGVSLPGPFKLDNLHPVEPLLSWNLCNFSTFILGTHSYYPRVPIIRKGNSSNFKIEWDRGFSVPGAFKLDYFHPFKPFWFRKFSTFFTFILGRKLLLPQRANNGKGEFSQLQNWMRQRVFSAWGIQTGPFPST